MVFRYLGHIYEQLWSREDGEEVAIKAAAKLVITAATAAAGENTGISKLTNLTV